VNQGIEVSNEPLKHLRQRPFGSRVKLAVTSWALIAFTHLLRLTWRQRRQPFEGAVEPHRHKGQGVILALYHGRHLPPVVAYRGRGIHVMTSQSRDGEMLARILRSWGYVTIRGSSSSGAVGAMKEMARKMKQGTDAVIAVDGPRGPYRDVKPGVLLLAKLTGSPIIPVAAAASSYWQIRSWDKYIIPKPGARTLTVFGEPIFVPRAVSDEALGQARVELGQTLDALQTQVDEAVISEAAAREMLGK